VEEAQNTKEGKGKGGGLVGHGNIQELCGRTAEALWLSEMKESMERFSLRALFEPCARQLLCSSGSPPVVTVCRDNDGEKLGEVGTFICLG